MFVGTIYTHKGMIHPSLGVGRFSCDVDYTECTLVQSKALQQKNHSVTEACHYHTPWMCVESFINSY